MREFQRIHRETNTNAGGEKTMKLAGKGIKNKTKGERGWFMKMKEIGGTEGRKERGRRVRGVAGWYNACHTPAIGGRFLCFRFLFVWDGSHCMRLTD